MDRFWTVLIWIILLSALLGVLRYWQGANALLKTFFGWFSDESRLLAGFNGGGGGVPNYPSYDNRGM